MQAERAPAAEGVPKVPTGITGFDEITMGGLPANRVSLVCGGPGCGKTLLAMEFAARGCRDYDEPAVFVSFEEPARHLAQNVASLGFDLPALISDGRLIVDHVRLDRREIEEAGEYDLDGLFVRLDHAIGSIGAKRVVLDTIEALFSAFANAAVLRAELRRLFRWLGERGVTAIVTAELGDGSLTRHNLEEYVSDCVITLDHRVSGELSTRRLRVVKYRGSLHGSNEYPFIVDEHGLSVLPLTSLRPDLPASAERVSSGIERLDAMLGGAGFWRGSSLLLTGHAGSGKTTLATTIAAAACERGERALLVLLEESPAEVVRNMSAVGLDLAPMLERGSLRCLADRPSAFGLETHLARLHKAVREFEPDVVSIDAVSALVGDQDAISSALRRLIDMVKATGATTIMTSLAPGGASLETSHAGVSSVIDTWIQLGNFEQQGERNRSIQVLKARGIAQSNQVREFLLSANGIEIRDAYVGRQGVLMGAARLIQEAKDESERLAREAEVRRRHAALEHHRARAEAQITTLRADIDAEAAAYDAWLTGAHAVDAEADTITAAISALRSGNGHARSEARS